MNTSMKMQPEPEPEPQPQPEPEPEPEPQRVLVPDTDTDNKMRELISLVNAVIGSTGKIENKTIVCGTALVYSLCFTGSSAFDKVYALAIMINAQTLTKNQTAAMRSIFAKLKMLIERLPKEQRTILFENPQTTKTGSKKQSYSEHGTKGKELDALKVIERKLIDEYQDKKKQILTKSASDWEDPVEGMVAQKTAAKKALNECREKIKALTDKM